MAGAVHREKEIEGRGFVGRLAVRLVQSLISVLRTAPDFVLYRPVNVIFRVGLDYEEPGARARLVELHWIVVVLHLQLVKHRMRQTLAQLLLLLMLLLLLLLLLMQVLLLVRRRRMLMLNLLLVLQ